MLEDTIARLIEAARALRRGYLAKFAALLKANPPTPSQIKNWRKRRKKSKKDAFGNLWLEYVYGWRPLVSDIYSAMNVFTKPPPDLTVGSVTGSVVGAVNDTVKVTGDPWFAQTTTRNYIQRNRLHVYYGMADSDIALFTKNFSRIGLTNPLELAWEILPYSFVIDWFLPIGNYLATLDASFALVFKGGYRNTKVIRTSNRAISGKGPPGAFTYVRGGSDDSYVETEFSRFIVTSFPTAGAPVLRDPLGVEHVLSALALLNQIFSSRE